MTEQPDAPSGRWTEDQLRGLAACLFGDPQPVPEPESAEDEAARRLMGNHVPREGTDPPLSQQSDDSVATHYVRALFDPYGPHIDHPQ